MSEVFNSIRRTPYQSLANFLILSFTLFLSTTLFIVLTFLYSFLSYIETRPQVTAYFQTKTEPSTIFKIRDELSRSDKILNIKYVSQEEAFKIYKQLNKDNPLLLEMVSADILPASLEIFAKKPVFLPEIAEFLKKQPSVDEVIFQKDIVSRLITLTSALRITAMIFFSFLIFMTIIILITTTSFKIALKKDELQLMQLLGASKSYIRKPFILEASLFGLSSALTSYSIILAIIFYLKPFFESYLRGVSQLSINIDTYQLIIWPINPLFLMICAIITFVFGLIISTLASFLAVQRYLK